MPDNLPGYDAWKTHDPADDLCAHCGANLTSRECRRGWAPDCCTGDCALMWRDPDYERDDRESQRTD